ncbi:MAG TPA: serine hydrolase [Cytophagales bacterium]|jgi:CubicO group peptidase (beta-lactamase class C family)|nr:serine hydrolase [Cytophagales bacterium]
MKRLLLLLLVITFGCSMDPKKNLDQLFGNEFKDNEPGAAVLLSVKGDTLIQKGYGIADTQSKEKITNATLFNIGSITKTVVSNTILKLAEEGKLSLNDSLSKYFHDFKNPKIANQVKLHFMLTHTSGLPDNRRKFLDAPYLLSADDQQNWDPIELNDSLAFEPGSHFEYSNPAFDGLALIIQKVSDRKWQEVVADKIFKPAGMLNSKITDGAFPTSGVAHGYINVLGEFTERDYGEEPTFAAAGNGGVWSSIKELAKYEQAIQKATFLKKETIDQSRSIMKYSNWADKNEPFMGYAWFITTTEDGAKVFSHTGTQGGFYADYVSIPEKEIFYVVLANRPFPREDFRKKIFETIGVKLKEIYVPK